MQLLLLNPAAWNKDVLDKTAPADLQTNEQDQVGQNDETKEFCYKSLVWGGGLLYT